MASQGFVGDRAPTRQAKKIIFQCALYEMSQPIQLRSGTPFLASVKLYVSPLLTADISLTKRHNQEAGAHPIFLPCNSKMLKGNDMSYSQFES